MPLRIGILDFNPEPMDSLRYPERISSFFPKGVKWQSHWFRGNPNISSYDALFLSGSRLSAAGYQEMNEIGKTEKGEYEDVARIAEKLALYHKPIYGICFGAQLLAYVMGGRLGSLDKTEAGYLLHELTEEGRKDKVFGFLSERFRGSHLHRDYVAQLPTGSVLATRNGLIHAYRIEKNGIISYGIQPHPEMSTPENAALLIRANESMLKGEIGTDEYEKALAIPAGADFELCKTITRFVENLV